MGRSRRTIPEELLLLALDPATGTTAQPQSLDLGLAGAQLVELALAGRIAPDGDRIAVVVPRPTGDPTLDSALELLRRRGAPVRAVHWIGGPRLGLRQTYLSHLERCGMVHAVEGQMCGVLPTTRYQATETAISREIRARLDNAIRTGVPPDPRTAALAALAHAVGLGKHLYPGNEGRSSRSRLRDLIRHDPMGGLVAHAVMDVQNGAATQPRRGVPRRCARPTGHAPRNRRPDRGTTPRASRTARRWPAPRPTEGDRAPRAPARRAAGGRERQPKRTTTEEQDPQRRTATPSRLRASRPLNRSGSRETAARGGREDVRTTPPPATPRGRARWGGGAHRPDTRRTRWATVRIRHRPFSSAAGGVGGTLLNSR